MYGFNAGVTQNKNKRRSLFGAALCSVSGDNRELLLGNLFPVFKEFLYARIGQRVLGKL